MSPADALQLWLKQTAAHLRQDHPPPSSSRDARRRAAAIRPRIRAAEGDWPTEKAPLDPRILGTLERDGYRVERLLFQTRPGCYATANAYVPAGMGPFPAVLCVHGHWAGARVDPVVQSRCIGLVKLGFLAFTLDAWGAGERGTQPGRNEYHGGLLGASLWPVGTPLHGLQLYDNVRALDYLQSRPDVNGERLGCTGASGGGNQTTYLSAFDPRVRCAVPVCSVGTFLSYFDTASCVDEVLLGGLTFAEQGDLLGMVAPGALMVITASRDAYHFGPGVARAALDRARPYFEIQGAGDRLRHVVIESGHAYSQEMREAMYGWMRRWLKDEGDGSPTPEPPVRPEDPAAIRCFDPAFRSGKVMTTVRWVHERARELADRAGLPGQPVGDWSSYRTARRRELRKLLALPRNGAGRPTQPDSLLETEPGVRIPYRVSLPPAGSSPAVAVLLHPAGTDAAADSAVGRALREAGVATLALELRGCGELTVPGQALGEAIPDHNLVEWSLWIGRPLLGQWVHDIRQALSFAADRLGAPAGRAALVGWREGGLAALLAAALEPRLGGAAAIEALASYVSETPPHGQRMVVFQPDLLKIGDVPHLAALSAPRPVLVANPLRLDGMTASEADVRELYRGPRDLWRALGKPENLTAEPSLRDEEIVGRVLAWVRD